MKAYLSRIPFDEKLNALSHGIAAIAAIVGWVILIIYAYESRVDYAMLSTFMYGPGLSMVFLSSTIYHAVIDKKRKGLWKLIDHICIYLLIAGTYTPVLLITVGGTLGWSLFVLQWTFAGLGIILKIFFIGRYKMLSVLSYVGMGWVAVFLLSTLYTCLAPIGFYLLLAGGLSYTIGVFFYLQKQSVYGHFIWHLFVIGGALFHYLMILLYIL